jgi:hypothetical protein
MVQLPADAGAVKLPLPSMLPHDVDQLAAMFAENCVVPMAWSAAVAGEMVIGEVTVAVAEAV